MIDRGKWGVAIATLCVRYEYYSRIFKDDPLHKKKPGNSNVPESFSTFSHISIYKFATTGSLLGIFMCQKALAPMQSRTLEKEYYS